MRERAVEFASNEPKDFRNYRMSLNLFEDLRDGDINPKELLKNQTRFKLNLNEIKIGGKKSVDQKNTVKNTTTLFDLREEIIDFFRDYSFLLSDVKCKTKYGEGLKILTSKQILQRLPIALAQVKGGKKSESLSNEIKHLFYQSKEINKKDI